ncbi:MAG: PilT/PilU family type 4a pilus ATPase [bacterium]
MATKSKSQKSPVKDDLKDNSGRVKSLKRPADFSESTIESSAAIDEALSLASQAISNSQDALKLADGNLAHMEMLEDKITQLFEKLEKTSSSITRSTGMDDKIKKLEKKVESELKEFNSTFSGLARDVKKLEGTSPDVKHLPEKIKGMLSKLERQMCSAQEEMSASLNERGRLFEESLTKIHEDMERLKTGYNALSNVDETLQTINRITGEVKECAVLSEESAERARMSLKIVDNLEEKVAQITGAVGGLSDAPGTVEVIPDVSEIKFDLDDLLQVMLKHEASDLHIKAGAPPTVRLDGELLPVGNQVLTEKDCSRLILPILTPLQRKSLAQIREVDLAHTTQNGRFRVNAFLQKGTVSAAFRLLKLQIPSMEEINLPPQLKKLVTLNHGLILVTGPAGSGKSTTLAAIIDHINTHRKLHIVTIEDPIEFMHTDKLSLVTQREIGLDTSSFTEALKQALRQDPNVILIGEMRDPETIMTAVIAAETGHLVLSTLHTPNTIQAVDRIIDVFSGDQQKQFRFLLANNLRGVISQRLLNRKDEAGRIPAVEVMMVTPTIASLILEGKTNDIYPHMVQGASEGMQTFTASLTSLFEAGLITKEEALYHAEQPTEFRLGIEGHTTGATATIQDESLMSWL